MDKWGIVAWIGFLVFLFIVVVYFKGFSSDVSSTGNAVGGLVQKLQGGGAGYPANPTAKGG